mmetsp:Transcript_11605/g.33444  ORF Transcript_11605/g.33444 Transcript_11605/m.33444 type:complete len:205 (-) Transcript_11605:228-842(-)
MLVQEGRASADHEEAAEEARATPLHAVKEAAEAPIPVQVPAGVGKASEVLALEVPFHASLDAIKRAREDSGGDPSRQARHDAPRRGTEAQALHLLFHEGRRAQHADHIDGIPKARGQVATREAVPSEVALDPAKCVSDAAAETLLLDHHKLDRRDPERRDGAAGRGPGRVLQGCERPATVDPCPPLDESRGQKLQPRLPGLVAH